MVSSYLLASSLPIYPGHKQNYSFPGLAEWVIPTSPGAPAIPTSPSRTGHRCQRHPPAAPLVLLAQPRPCPCAAGVSATTSIEPFRAWAEEVRNQGTELLLWLVPSDESTIYVYISLRMSVLCYKSQNGSQGLTTTWSIPHPTPQTWCCPNSHPKPHSVLAQSKDDALLMATNEGLPQRLKERNFKKEEAKNTSYQCFLHNE